VLLLIPFDDTAGLDLECQNVQANVCEGVAKLGRLEHSAALEVHGYGLSALADRDGYDTFQASAQHHFGRCCAGRSRDAPHGGDDFSDARGPWRQWLRSGRPTRGHQNRQSDERVRGFHGRDPFHR
jgi:hypothetical protein